MCLSVAISFNSIRTAYKIFDKFQPPFTKVSQLISYRLMLINAVRLDWRRKVKLHNPRLFLFNKQLLRHDHMGESFTVSTINNPVRGEVAG